MVVGLEFVSEFEPLSADLQNGLQIVGLFTWRRVEHSHSTATPQSSGGPALLTIAKVATNAWAHARVQSASVTSRQVV